MLHVIREAVYLYRDDPDAFARLRRRAMEQDFSWDRSAGEYLKIYAAVTGLSPEKKSARPAAADTTDAPDGFRGCVRFGSGRKAGAAGEKSGSRKVRRKRREKPTRKS